MEEAIPVPQKGRQLVLPLPPRGPAPQIVTPTTPRGSGKEPLREGGFQHDEHLQSAGNPLRGVFGDNPVVLIDPKKINDFRRFRFLFYGMLLLINTSTQGLFVLFGFYIEKLHNYDTRAMVDIYTAGTVFGLFVFPFGLLYDFFGPRIVVAMATVITATSHLLFALTFSGHIESSKTRYCVFFAMMNWGCYAFDVAVLPAVLTHIPRDRAQPTGLLKTFSGLGPSIFSCIFRGFFNDRYDRFMYFLMIVVIVFGLIGGIFLKVAPYEVTRWEERRLTLEERLKKHLVRNRYMSQLLPKRRLHLLSLLMMVLNVYLSAQAILVARNKDTLTSATYKGLAFGAIAIVASLLIILLPVHFLDGPTPQDERVIKKAYEKARELEERQKRHDLDGKERAMGDAEESKKDLLSHDAATSSVAVSFPPITVNEGVELKLKSVRSSDHVKCSDPEVGVEEIKSHPYEPVYPDAELVEIQGMFPLDAVRENETSQVTQRLSNRSFVMVLQPSDVLTTGVGSNGESAEVEALTRQVSTYDSPYIEAITVCGEVFFPPVYETTFLKSLTYMDIWLIFYTTIVVWGIGMMLTANWNILIMVGSRHMRFNYEDYVLFATLSGISTAVGRVIIGTYEVLLVRFGLRNGISLAATIGFPVPSVLLTVALFLYLILPDSMALLAVYVIAPLAYGFSTSITIYVIAIIFKRDIGMHYGFCFLGNALGILLLFRVLFFDVYDRHKIVMPPGISIDTRGRCQGRECMRTTLIVCLLLAASSIITSYLVHYRYWKLVRGKLKYRRVIVPLVKKRFSRRRADKEGV